MGFIVSQTTLECNRELVSRPASRRLLLSLVISLVSGLCNTWSPLFPRACTCCTQPSCLTYKILRKRRLGNTKVVVKEAAQQPQPEEALTMTASVKGVKTIELDFNKAIASPDAVKVTVKKGTADRECKATVDGSKITLAMTAKLIAGEYTVTVSGAADTDLVATVTVEKDETLTSFYIGENLIQTTMNATAGYIYYAPLNQYGEKMNANDPTANCTFGEYDKTDSASATGNGKIWIKNIPSILAIKGTTGTLVLVDSTTGVSSTGTVTFSDPATASEVEMTGFYNANKSAMQDITEQDNPRDYKLLMTVKDQYGNEMEAKDLVGVTASIAGGLTNVVVAENGNKNDATKAPSYFSDVVVNGKSYIALSLGDAYAKAGTFTLTMVNSNKGLLTTTSFDVAKYVVIKSIKITADNGLYNNQDNELTYEITDADGKNVTSYAVLKSTVGVLNASYFESVRWEKQSDGSAKLIAHPLYNGFGDAKNTKETTIGTLTLAANTNTSSDYMVNTFTLTISEDRIVTGITGIDASVKTTTVIGSDIDIAYDKIVYADQYGNKVAKGDGIYPKNATQDLGAATGTEGCSVFMDKNNSYFTAKQNTAKNKYTFTASQTPGSATVYLKYYNAATEAAKKTASPSNYDQKVILTSVKTTSVDPSTLKIDSINDGYAYNVLPGQALSVSTSAIKVTAKMGGTEVTIPTAQYVVKSCDNNKITTDEDSKGTKEKTATVTVVVSTYDNNNLETVTTLTGEYKISTKNAEIAKICDVDDNYAVITRTTGAAITSADFEKLFKYDDQYGIAGDKGGTPINATDAMTKFGATSLNGVTYSLNVINGVTKNITTKGEGTNGAQVVFAVSSSAYNSGCTYDKDAKAYCYIVKVTATLNGTSKTQTLKVIVS